MNQQDTAESSDRSGALNTWTIVGHWDCSTIVVEYVVEGPYQDPRVDTGYWPEGLFSAPGRGHTLDEAIAAVRAEYEPHDG